MELPLYAYKPLDSGHIRTLDLLPDGTSCMKHVKLKPSSTSVRYAALSYTWGASTEAFPFQCNSANLPVRQNLLNALNRLKSIVGLPLWVDSMCINQSDEIEKMGQIQMMTDIYKSAKTVYIWLGEEIPQTQETVEQIPSVTAKLKNLKQPIPSLDSIISPSFVEGVRHLLTCAWWSRLWVLQEATVAQDAVFVCGPHIVPWKVLSALAKQIHRLELRRYFRGTSQRIEFCDGFTELQNVESVRHRHSTTLATNLLRICRQRMCFDPCDRVYGVIGLTDRYVQESFTWQPGETVEELYPAFAAILLQLDPTAELLSLNETTERNPKLPSWCPDLHHRSVSDILADHEGYHAGFTIQTTPKFEYDDKFPNQIRAWGIVADTVKTIDPDMWEAKDEPNEASDADNLCTEMRSNVLLLQKHTLALDRFVNQEELWRVFVGNMLGTPDSKLHLLAGFSSIHDRLASRRWKSEASAYQHAFTELRAWSPSTTDKPSPAVQTYLESARKVCYGRQLFTTEGGRIGYGPRTMEVGDAVCIFKCVKVPFVLKKHDSLPNTWCLRGEAYVHSMMHGEYLKTNKNFYWITLV